MPKLATNRNQPLLLACKFFVSMLAFGWLAYSIDWQTLPDQFNNINWVLLAMAFPVFVLRLIPLAMRWVGIAREANYLITYRESIYWYYVGGFFNTFLPTGRGGDVIRGYFVARQRKVQFTGLMTTILIERIIGLVVAISLILVASLFMIGRCPQLKSVMFSLLMLVSVLGISFFVIFHPLLRKMIITFAHLFPWLHIEVILQNVFAVMDRCWRNPRVLLAASFYSFINQLLYIFSSAVIGSAIVGFDASWYSFSIVIPLIFLSEILPSVGGYGVREVGFVVFFGWFGVGLDQAVAYGILQLLFLWGSALFGAILFLKGRSTSRETTTAPHITI